jgi:hypothetical protein
MHLGIIVIGSSLFCIGYPYGKLRTALEISSILALLLSPAIFENTNGIIHSHDPFGSHISTFTYNYPMIMLPSLLNELTHFQAVRYQIFLALESATPSSKPKNKSIAPIPDLPGARLAICLQERYLFLRISSKNGDRLADLLSNQLFYFNNLLLLNLGSAAAGWNAIEKNLVHKPDTEYDRETPVPWICEWSYGTRPHCRFDSDP